MQNRINEFIEAILYQLLNEILRTEQESLHNRQINRAFEMYFKSCIDRMNKVVQGIILFIYLIPRKYHQSV